MPPVGRFGERQQPRPRRIVEAKSSRSRTREERTMLDRLDVASNTVALAAFLVGLVCLFTDTYSAVLMAQVIGVVGLVVNRVARWAGTRHSLRTS